MPKTTIEQISEIAETLESELRSTGAIDAQGNVIKPQMFLDIITHKEDELRPFYSEVESEAGVVTDRNAFNILEKYMWKFDEMKKEMSMNPEDKELPEEPLVTQEKAAEERAAKPAKPSAFKAGIQRLFGKIKAKVTPTNSDTNDR